VWGLHREIAALGGENPVVAMVFMRGVLEGVRVTILREPYLPKRSFTAGGFETLTNLCNCEIR
jgi:hypothetical protein